MKKSSLVAVVVIVAGVILTQQTQTTAQSQNGQTLNLRVATLEREVSELKRTVGCVLFLVEI